MQGNYCWRPVRLGAIVKEWKELNGINEKISTIGFWLLVVDQYPRSTVMSRHTKSVGYLMNSFKDYCEYCSRIRF